MRRKRRRTMSKWGEVFVVSLLSCAASI